MSTQTIVIIDDDPEVDAISAFLPDFNLIFEQEAKLAINTIQKENADLVLLDYNMPDLTGFEIALRIRKTKGIENTPIIFTTAIKDTSIEENAYRMFDVREWLVKPLNLNLLSLTVERHFQLSNNRASRIITKFSPNLLVIGCQGNSILENISIPTATIGDNSKSIKLAFDVPPIGALITTNINECSMSELVDQCKTHGIPIIGIIDSRKMGPIEGKIEKLLQMGATSTVLQNTQPLLLNAKLKALVHINN